MCLSLTHIHTQSRKTWSHIQYALRLWGRFQREKTRRLRPQGVITHLQADTESHKMRLESYFFTPSSLPHSPSWLACWWSSESDSGPWLPHVLATHRQARQKPGKRGMTFSTPASEKRMRSDGIFSALCHLKTEKGTLPVMSFNRKKPEIFLSWRRLFDFAGAFSPFLPVFVRKCFYYS